MKILMIPTSLLVIIFVPSIHSDNRISGGSETTPHAYPFTVLLKGYGNYLYGTNVFTGVILNREWILTTANNLYNVYHVQAFIGVHNRSSDISPEGGVGQGLRVTSHEFYPHERYDVELHYSYGDNNVGLIKLPYPLDLTREHVQAAVLKASPPETGTAATIVGWGDHDGGNISFSQVLRQDTFMLDVQDQCKESYDEIIVDYSDLLCFPTNDVGRGVCFGDLGAPVMTSDKTVFGLVAFYHAFDCGSGRPFMAVDVSKHLDWIRKHAGEINVA